MQNKLALSLLAVLCLSTTLTKGAEPAAELEDNFYRAVSSGDANAAYNQMHPAAQELVDMPVFETWSGAVREHLGSHVSTNRISTTNIQQLAGVRVNIESEVVFERGTAKATMGFFDGQMVAFNVQSDQLVGWFTGPTRLDPYTEKAEAFIAAFIGQESEKAWSLMHDALKKMLPGNGLETMMQSIGDNGGSLRSLKLRNHQMVLEDDSQTLVLEYDLECERASGQCTIEFQFVGMKGHLVSFRFR